MKSLAHLELDERQTLPLVPQSSGTIAVPSVVGPAASNQLLRMFRDPRVLEPEERRSLVTELRRAVELAPQMAEVRVLLGMALCVDIQAQEALEVLREAVRMAPDSFIARLKFGELLMRLRICDQAAEETHQAALLAANAAQSELARRQAATIRTMLREGIERGGYRTLFSGLLRFRRKSGHRNNAPVLMGSK